MNGSQCTAYTAQGMRCQVRSRKPGACTKHRKIEAQHVDAKAYVHRCAGKTVNDGVCFVRVRHAGDKCASHRDRGSLDQLWRVVSDVRDAVEQLRADVNELRGHDERA